jgi:hypothetical protein
MSYDLAFELITSPDSGAMTILAFQSVPLFLNNDFEGLPILEFV